jgi:hypothetical protein
MLTWQWSMKWDSKLQMQAAVVVAQPTQECGAELAVSISCLLRARCAPAADSARQCVSAGKSVQLRLLHGVCAPQRVDMSC